MRDAFSARGISLQFAVAEGGWRVASGGRRRAVGGRRMTSASVGLGLTSAVPVGRCWTIYRGVVSASCTAAMSFALGSSEESGSWTTASSDRAGLDRASTPRLCRSSPESPWPVYASLLSPSRRTRDRSGERAGRLASALTYARLSDRNCECRFGCDARGHGDVCSHWRFWLSSQRVGAGRSTPVTHATHGAGRGQGRSRGRARPSRLRSRFRTSGEARCHGRQRGRSSRSSAPSLTRSTRP